jgi:hypothetical protein
MASRLVPVNAMVLIDSRGVFGGFGGQLGRGRANLARFRGLDATMAPSYLQLIPIHRFPAAHSCARRFFV